MGKHIKTQIDYDMIEGLAKEVFRLDPTNSVLKKFSSMDNYEGAELRKSIGVKSIDDFDIESLDPDKRSWYYDDTGVKRKKDEF